MERSFTIFDVKVSVGIISISSQIYLLPTIKITHDKTLYGFKNIEFWWWKWGVEILIK